VHLFLGTHQIIYTTVSTILIQEGASCPGYPEQKEHNTILTLEGQEAWLSAFEGAFQIT